jgi:hypothetical protein
MEKIIENPLQENKKKISLDIEGSLLEMVDKLAELTKSSRTVVIEALLGKGYHVMLDTLRASWTTMRNSDISKEKKEKLKDLLGRLDKLGSY